VVPIQWDIGSFLNPAGTSRVTEGSVHSRSARGNRASVQFLGYSLLLAHRTGKDLNKPRGSNQASLHAPTLPNMPGNHCFYWSYLASKMDASSARITVHHASRHPDRLALVVELCSGRLLLPLRRAFSTLPLVAPACLPVDRRLAGSVAVALEFVEAGSVSSNRPVTALDAGVASVGDLLATPASDVAFDFAVRAASLTGQDSSTHTTFCISRATRGS